MTSRKTPDPVGYLAACFRADNRSSSVRDLFHKDVRHRHFATGQEVIVSGLLPGLAVPTELGVDTMKAAATYKRERQLVYAAFVVCGSVTRADGSAQSIAAPVVYYPAKLEEHRDHTIVLEPDVEEQRANFDLFSDLLGEERGSPEALEAFLTRVPTPPFGAAEISELMTILREVSPELDVEPLYRYPELVPAKEISKRRRAPGLACLPAAALALVPNPPAARGIAFELAQSEMSAEPSTPLAALLGRPLPPHVSEPSTLAETTSVPAELSAAQQKIVSSARAHPLTLVVGPPGTGKSFTVAAVAVDHILRGQSVLISCRTDSALDVIEEKLSAMLGDTTLTLRGGSRGHHRQLKSYLEGLLSGRTEDEGAPSNRSLERELHELMRTVVEAETHLERRTELEHEFITLDERRASGLGLWDRIRAAWLDWRIERATPHWILHEALLESQRRRIEMATRHLREVRDRQIRRVVDEHRSDLKSFLGALRARTSARQDRLFDRTEMAPLLQAFPLWLSTFRDLYRLAPFAREMFDVVVVDEATQSDMASALPALHRAKRAVVTGDPRQLRHVSFLSRHRQRRLGHKHGIDEDLRTRLDYRERSLLDATSDALGSNRQVAFLNEHFRSMPQIIAFSNREFYDGALRVMTERPQTIQTPALELRRLDGVRGDDGVNRREAEAVVDELERQIEMDGSPASTRKRSIGILSPFRDQLEHLRELVAKRIGLDAIEAHDLLFGTAYGFQGQERDVMLLSLAVDPRSHSMSFRYLSQADVFNVAITRARSFQIVFTSLPESALDDSVVGRYLRFSSQAMPAPRSQGRSGIDAFVIDISERLAREGFEAWPHYRVAGTEVDLVVERDGRSLGIDLIAGPDDFGAALELERYRMFARAGLPLVPVPLSAWRRDPEACITAIESRHVAPRG